MGTPWGSIIYTIELLESRMGVLLVGANSGGLRMEPGLDPEGGRISGSKAQ